MDSKDNEKSSCCDIFKNGYLPDKEQLAEKWLQLIKEEWNGK